MSLRMLRAIVVCFAVSIPPVLGAGGCHEDYTCAPNGGVEGATLVQKKKSVVKDDAQKDLEAAQTWESSWVNFKASLHRLQDNTGLLAKDCKAMADTAKNTCHAYTEAALHSVVAQAIPSPTTRVIEISDAHLKACQALESSGSTSLLQTDDMEASALGLVEVATTFASFESHQGTDAHNAAEAFGKLASWLGSSKCTLITIGSQVCNRAQEALSAMAARMDVWADESNGFADQAAQIEASINSNLLDQSVKASGLAQTNATKRQAAILEEHVSLLADLVDKGRHADEVLSEEVSQICRSLASLIQVEKISSQIMVQVLTGTLTSAIMSSMEECASGLANVGSRASRS